MEDRNKDKSKKQKNSRSMLNSKLMHILFIILFHF